MTISKNMGFKSILLSKYKINALKPLEHFDVGIQPFWSIQTQNTHGRKGVIRVSRSKLEDMGMAIQTRPDYIRMAGAEDIFQGSKLDLLRYIKLNYKNFKTIEFKKE